MDSKKMRALLRAQPDGHSPRTGNIAHLINQSDEVAAHAKEAIASAESLTRRTRRLLATLGIGWTEPSRISAQNLWD